MRFTQRELSVTTETGQGFHNDYARIVFQPEKSLFNYRVLGWGGAGYRRAEGGAGRASSISCPETEMSFIYLKG